MSDKGISYSGPGAPWGVVVLAHGSQRGKDTPQGLQELVERLQVRLEGEGARVVMACLEFIRPDLPEAVCNLYDQGCKRIVVMPFLLGQGTHLTEDLEEETGRALQERPEAKVTAARPFGPDPVLVDIAADRVRQQVARLDGALPGDGSPRGVMLVKAGTRSPSEDHQWFVEMGRSLEAVLGEGYAVEVAQSHFGPPTVEAGVARLVEERGASSVICVPYLFFPGLILTRNIEGSIEDLKGRYPQVGFSITPTLGIEDRLVELTAQRVLEARERMEAREAGVSSPAGGEG